MPRYLLEIEYDGANFCGWQRQDNVLTVQHVIEKAIEKLTQKRITLFVSGRTDTGVHAHGQVAHFDCHKPLPTDTVQSALNYFLKRYLVSIKCVRIVPRDFHARFDAVERQYIYRIMIQNYPPALLRQQVWWLKHPLDYAKMHKAGQVLIGTHDFSSFRASGCQAKSPVRTIDAISVQKVGENEIQMLIRAKSFL